MAKRMESSVLKKRHMSTRIYLVIALLVTFSSAIADSPIPPSSYFVQGKNGDCYAHVVFSREKTSSFTEFFLSKDSTQPFMTYPFYISQGLSILCNQQKNGVEGLSVILAFSQHHGHLASHSHMGLAFLFNNELLSIYSALDIALHEENVKASISNYFLFENRPKFGKQENGRFSYQVETLDGRLLSFDTLTGESLTETVAISLASPSNIRAILREVAPKDSLNIQFCIACFQGSFQDAKTYLENHLFEANPYFLHLLIRFFYKPSAPEKSYILKLSQHLFNNGYPIDLINEEGQTPLIEAIENNELWYALWLLAYNPNIKISDKQGNTALSYTLQTCNSDLSLIAFDAFYTNPETISYNRTSAIECIALIIQLLEKGSNIADLEHLDPNGRSLLLRLILKGDIAKARVLLEYGISANSNSPHVEKPLGIAFQYGDTDFIKLLLEKGAQPYVTN